MEKLLFGYRYLNSYKLSVVFKPIKVLTRQKILPGDGKNSTMDGQSQLTPCGHEQTFPTYEVSSKTNAKVQIKTERFKIES